MLRSASFFILILVLLFHRNDTSVTHNNHSTSIISYVKSNITNYHHNFSYKMRNFTSTSLDRIQDEISNLSEAHIKYENQIISRRVDFEVEEALIFEHAMTKGTHVLKVGITSIPSIFRTITGTLVSVASLSVKSAGGLMNVVSDILNEVSSRAHLRQSKYILVRSSSMMLSMAIHAVAVVLHGLGHACIVAGDTVELITVGLGQSLEDSFIGLNHVVTFIHRLVLFSLRRDNDSHHSMNESENASYRYPSSYADKTKSHQVNHKTSTSTLSSMRLGDVDITPHLGLNQINTMPPPDHNHDTDNDILNISSMSSSPTFSSLGRGRDPSAFDRRRCEQNLTFWERFGLAKLLSGMFGNKCNKIDMSGYLPQQRDAPTQTIFQEDDDHHEDVNIISDDHMNVSNADKNHTHDASDISRDNNHHKSAEISIDPLTKKATAHLGNTIHNAFTTSSHDNNILYSINLTDSQPHTLSLQPDHDDINQSDSHNLDPNRSLSYLFWESIAETAQDIFSNRARQRNHVHVQPSSSSNSQAGVMPHDTDGGMIQDDDLPTLRPHIFVALVVIMMITYTCIYASTSSTTSSITGNHSTSSSSRQLPLIVSVSTLNLASHDDSVDMKDGDEEEASEESSSTKSSWHPVVKAMLIRLMRFFVILISIIILWFYLAFVESVYRDRLLARNYARSVYHQQQHNPSVPSPDKPIYDPYKNDNMETTHWLNAAVQALWSLQHHDYNHKQFTSAETASFKVYEDGGLGPYMGLTIKNMLMRQLALVPPGIANVQLKNLLLGSQPPIILGARAIRRPYASTCLQYTSSSSISSSTTTASMNDTKSTSLSHLQLSPEEEYLIQTSSLFSSDKLFDKISHSIAAGVHHLSDIAISAIQSLPTSSSSPYHKDSSSYLCEQIVTDIDFSFVSKDMDLVFTLRPNDMKSVLPEGAITISDLSMRGRIRMHIDMIPDYPFVGNATLSFIDFPVWDMTVSSFGGIDLSSIPGMYHWINITMTWLLEQYNYPKYSPIDLKHTVCPSCGKPPPPTAPEILVDIAKSLANHIQSSTRNAIHHLAHFTAPSIHQQVRKTSDKVQHIVSKVVHRIVHATNQSSVAYIGADGEVFLLD